MSIKGDSGNFDKELRDLGVDFVDQNDFEKQLMEKADKAMTERESRLDQNRLAKAEKQKTHAQNQLKILKTELQKANDKDKIILKINEQTKRLQEAAKDKEYILDRIKHRENSNTMSISRETTQRQMNESQKDYLIRIGKITPFSNLSENTIVQLDQTTLPGTQYSATHQIQEKQRKNKRIRDDGDSDYRLQDIEEDYELNNDKYAEKGKHVAPKLDETYEDDGNETIYKRRIKKWLLNRKIMRCEAANYENDTFSVENIKTKLEDLDEDEIFQPHPEFPDHEIDVNLKVPGELWNSLFDYQKTCIKWLWELHQQEVGGILGDEMGLGKTIQVIGFLSSLQYSNILGSGKPSIIVCPATVMKQWVQEFHKWWPPQKVAVLHSSGSGMRTGNKDQNDSEEEIDDSGILITTYSGVQTYRKLLLKHKWGYVVLDEGHKIRNPDSETTLAIKQFKSPHRIILSGTPIQNNLKELWSLFDFIFPGRLGTLPVFQSQFSVPINIGGYANATTVQVQTAYKCACMLRDLINPYLLRRMKADVAYDLPKKNEQVLFCKLTELQRLYYMRFIQSKEMDSILEHRRHALYGIDIVRKICNHPDLADLTITENNPDYGNPEKSGKMVVVSALLKLWKIQGHRVLLFCQTRQMLNINESMVNSLGYLYMRMDGTTPVNQRIALVNEFNSNQNIFVFLLTTKVGGLGLNLTGANRIILFDPDWNPSTDIQARERAWRLGQTKDVTIYRLLTSGTIEEKIYHRQIYKQFLTNKILKDPKQKRFFDASNLQSLFTLSSENTEETETGQLFKGAEINFKKKKEKDRDNLTSLDGIDSLEQYVENSHEKKNQEDDHVLQSLFEMTGIQSALKHDNIIDSNSHEADIVEKEANFIAKRAAEALKESRKLRRVTDISTPTWTGRSGYVGAPKYVMEKSRPNFGKPSENIQEKKSLSFGTGDVSGFKKLGDSKPSSMSLLAGIKERKALQDNTEVNSPVSITILDDNTKESMIVKLRNFLSQHNGRASSQEIMENLTLNIQQEQIIIFRKMLQQIAKFEKNEDNKKGFWTLKQEFY